MSETLPTQVARPWRSTVRTVFQIGVALATLIPFLASGVYDDLDAAPVVVGQILAVCATVTRVMALPQVEEFLARFAPWLAADPSRAADLDGSFGERVAMIERAAESAPPPSEARRPRI